MLYQSPGHGFGAMTRNHVSPCIAAESQPLIEFQDTLHGSLPNSRCHARDQSQADALAHLSIIPATRETVLPTTGVASALSIPSDMQSNCDCLIIQTIYHNKLDCLLSNLDQLPFDHCFQHIKSALDGCERFLQSRTCLPDTVHLLSYVSTLGLTLQLVDSWLSRKFGVHGSDSDEGYSLCCGIFAFCQDGTLPVHSLMAQRLLLQLKEVLQWSQRNLFSQEDRLQWQSDPSAKSPISVIDMTLSGLIIGGSLRCEKFSCVSDGANSMDLQGSIIHYQESVDYLLCSVTSMYPMLDTSACGGTF